MRKTPSKAPRRPITQHNAHASPQRSSAVPNVSRARPGTVLTQHVRFQMATSPYSPKAVIGMDEKPSEDKALEQTGEAGNASQSRESQSASPMQGKYRKKYEIENHTYLGIPGASVFAGVLQRDEVSILKEKKAQQQQEVKAALQLQILEKQRRLEAEKHELLKAVEGEETAVEGSSPGKEESIKLQANPQSDETPEEPHEPAPPSIHHLYTEILKEHESLKAKVESQEAWIQQLIYRSISQTRNRSPLTKKPSPKPRSKKVQALSANQRRAHSSAAGLPIDVVKPNVRPSDFSLFLEESGEEAKGGLSIPVTSAATPVHRVPERNLDAGGDSMFLYPSSKGVFEEWRHELKNFPTEEIPHRRETSVPRQRREKTPNLRFPKDVFPMSIKRRPAII